MWMGCVHVVCVSLDFMYSIRVSCVDAMQHTCLVGTCVACVHAMQCTCVDVYMVLMCNEMQYSCLISL